MVLRGIGTFGILFVPHPLMAFSVWSGETCFSGGRTGDWTGAPALTEQDESQTAIRCLKHKSRV